MEEGEGSYSGWKKGVVRWVVDNGSVVGDNGMVDNAVFVA